GQHVGGDGLTVFDRFTIERHLGSGTNAGVIAHASGDGGFAQEDFAVTWGRAHQFRAGVVHDDAVLEARAGIGGDGDAVFAVGDFGGVQHVQETVCRTVGVDGERQVHRERLVRIGTTGAIADADRGRVRGVGELHASGHRQTEATGGEIVVVE